MYDGTPICANIINSDFCAKIAKYFFDSGTHGNPHFRKDNKQVVGSSVMICEPHIDKMAVELKTYVEECFRKPMLPTYTCMRLYKKGDALPIHTDREACEYSLSVAIARSNENPDLPYTLFFKNPDGTELGVSCDIGDGVFYKGMEIPHFRYPCPHDWYLAAFFHYVERGGEIYQSYYDKHPDLDEKEMCHLYRY